MRGLRPLLLAVATAGLSDAGKDAKRRASTPSLVVASLLLAAGLAGCLYSAPPPEEALPPVEAVDGSALVREIRAVNEGLDSSSPPAYLELARTRLANLSARVDSALAEGSLSPEDAAAARAALAEEQDSLFWIGVAADARRDPTAAFALAENKTLQGEARLANATDFADVGKARSDLLHAQAILVALEVYRPDAVEPARFDALASRVEADLQQANAWGAS